MDNVLLLNKIVDLYCENGGMLYTDSKDKFNENETIDIWFKAKLVSGHLMADSEYFYSYDEYFKDMDANVILTDGEYMIYLFLIK